MSIEKAWTAVAAENGTIQADLSDSYGRNRELSGELANLCREAD